MARLPGEGLFISFRARVRVRVGVRVKVRVRLRVRVRVRLPTAKRSMARPSRVLYEER